MHEEVGEDPWTCTSGDDDDDDDDFIGMAANRLH